MKSRLRRYAYYKTVQGMCRTCRQLVNARVFEEEGHVYQENMCPACGNTRTLLANDRDWYFDTLQTPKQPNPPSTRQTASQNGCPFDCGVCTWHETAPNLPVLSITNTCNLNCPICFTYNRPEVPYHMSLEEMRATIAFLLKTRKRYDLINITGGEPTLHPQLIDLLKVAQHDRIGRITVNSNGIRLAQDEKLVQALSDLGVYVILSLHTLDQNTSKRIHGIDLVDTKLKALETLNRYNIGTTLLNVMIQGVNDHEIGDIAALSQHYPNIRSLTIQNMTYTGQGGASFTPHQRLTIDMVHDRLEQDGRQDIRRDHFFPLPTAHPLCYSIAYYFKTDTGWESLTNWLTPEEIRRLIGNNYLIQPNDQFHDVFQEAIARSWSAGKHPEILDHLKKLLKKMYPHHQTLSTFERQRIAEAFFLTVYIHAHMDEDNLDLARLTCCPDLVPVDADRLIPACAYNLFYRQQDPRFHNPSSTNFDQNPSKRSQPLHHPGSV